MNELIELIFKLKFKELFFRPTDNGLIKFFRYAFVGGIAFIVDYLLFAIVNIGCTALILNKAIAVAIATTAGFIGGIIVNFILSKKFVFTENTKVGKKYEFILYLIIGIVGYFINMGLMQIFIWYINEYVSKIIVALIVLVYNYTARKLILYTNREEKN